MDPIFRARHLARQGRLLAARLGLLLSVAARLLALRLKNRGKNAPPPPPLADAREILVIRPDEIGDFVLASAFLRELRRAAPAARITLVAKRAVLPLARNCPCLDRVVVLDWESPLVSAFGGPGLRHVVLRLARDELSSARYDYVLLPRRGPDLHEASLLARAVDSLCVARAGSGSPSKNLLYSPRPDRAFSGEKSTPETAHGLAFLRFLGAPADDDRLQLWPSETDLREADAFLRDRFDPRRPLVVLHPSGGRSPLKQWPLDRFQTVAARLAAEAGAQLLVIGGPEERAWIASAFPASDHPRVLPAPGDIPLPLLAALMPRAALFVGGDSGPAHLAAAAGVPVVAVFGPTSLRRFSPVGPLVRVLSARLPCSPDELGTHEDRCQSCIHSTLRCMLDVSADRVAEAALALLGRGRTAPAA